MTIGGPFDSWSAYLMNKPLGAIQEGWKCPSCHTIYAPTITACFCQQREKCCKDGGTCACKDSKPELLNEINNNPDMV